VLTFALALGIIELMLDFLSAKLNFPRLVLLAIKFVAINVERTTTIVKPSPRLLGRIFLPSSCDYRSLSSDVIVDLSHYLGDWLTENQESSEADQVAVEL